MPKSSPSTDSPFEAVQSGSDALLYRTKFSPRVRVTLDCSRFPSRTKQSFKDECDLNIIMKRYELSGDLPAHLARGNPTYGDFSAVDFQDAMLRVAQAKADFLALPSALRSRFGNDPAQLLSFLDDPANEGEAEKLGLIAPRNPVAASKGVEGTPTPSEPVQTLKTPV